MNATSLVDSREIDKLSDENWIHLLTLSNLNFCPFASFSKVMKKSNILYALTVFLHDVVGITKYSANKIEYALGLADKALFLKFRNKEITYDQLRARGAAKHGYAKYVVLDDLRNKLHPNLVNGMEKFEATFRMTYGLEPGSKETVPVDAIL